MGFPSLARARLFSKSLVTLAVIRVQEECNLMTCRSKSRAHN